MGQSATDGDLPLNNLLNVLRRRKPTIFGVVFLLTSLTTVYGLSIEPTYTGTASVIIEPRDSHVVDVEQVLPGLTTDLIDVENQVDIIQSHALVVQTMEQLRLFDDPEFVADAVAEASGLAKLVQTGSDWVREQLRAAKALVLAWLRGWLVTLGVVGADEISMARIRAVAGRGGAGAGNRHLS